MDGAFKSGCYRNVFTELGYLEEDVNKKILDSFQLLFYGLPEERIYYPVGEDLGYIVDTGNHDVRTEGMSYGMMMCVQLDKKEEFDRLWNWAKTYMYMDTGVNKGYFAWSCKTDGTQNSYGPAPDGEEYFALALFFASNRWGMGMVFLIIAKKRENFFMNAFTKENWMELESLCGSLQTI